MTHKEKTEIYDLARKCTTYKARHNNIDFHCYGADCSEEMTKNLDWLMQDHRPPVVPRMLNGMIQINNHQWVQNIDWSKIPIDTLVEVWNKPDKKYKRYFAKYENNVIYCWSYGRTSKTATAEDYITDWHYVKLTKE